MTYNLALAKSPPSTGFLGWPIAPPATSFAFDLVSDARYRYSSAVMVTSALFLKAASVSWLQRQGR